MSFARPDLLPLALFIPALLAFLVWLHGRRRRRAADRYSDPGLLVRLGGAPLLRPVRRRLGLIVLAGTALGLAAAGPRWGLRETGGRALSLNVVVVADISRSMLVEDVQPNRLERTRLFARQLLRSLPGDRFGLVAFAGRAWVLSPLTVDHSALELYLDALDPEMVSQGGSSLAAAIAQGTDLLRGGDRAGGDRVMVLLTDGEAHEEAVGVRSAAERAARAGIRIIAIGAGTAQGGRIPDVDPASGQVVGFKRDEYGELVISRMDEELLRSVADAAGGRFIDIGQPGALNEVVATLRRLDRAEGEETAGVEPRERFALFAALALLLLALDTLLYGAHRGAPPSSPPARTGSAAPPARAALLVLLVAVATGFGPGDLERGNRLHREGRYAEAVEAYQRALEGGSTSPRLHYNLGTALLALGRHEDAGRHLQAALADIDPELRERAFYNLGNRFLTEARAEDDVSAQGALLDAAIEAYRRTLRLDPADVDAKWNLELALRDREDNRQRQQSMPQRAEDEEQGGPGGDEQQESGGGAGSDAPQAGAGPGGEGGGTPDERPMTQEEAERLLGAIEQDERELTQRRMRRGDRRVPVLRDW